MTDNIDWISGSPPIAAPVCGFQGEKCISKLSRPPTNTCTTDGKINYPTLCI